MLGLSDSSPVKTVFHPVYGQLIDLLKTARVEGGVTQSALAAMIGHPQSYVSKYEAGEKRLDIIELLAIAKALNLRASLIVQQLEEG